MCFGCFFIVVTCDSFISTCSVELRLKLSSKHMPKICKGCLNRITTFLHYEEWGKIACFLSHHIVLFTDFYVFLNNLVTYYRDSQTVGLRPTSGSWTAHTGCENAICKNTVTVMTSVSLPTNEGGHYMIILLALISDLFEINALFSPTQIRDTEQ